MLSIIVILATTAPGKAGGYCIEIYGEENIYVPSVASPWALDAPLPVTEVMPKSRPMVIASTAGVAMSSFCVVGSRS
jgi:hypothetical protein